MQKKYEEKAKKQKKLVFLFCHSVIGLFSCLMLTLLFSMLIYFEKIDISMIEILCCVAVFLGATISSSLSCKKFRKNFFTAMIQAVLFLGICYFLGAFLNVRFLPSKNALPSICSCFAGAVFGAVVIATFGNKKMRK